MKRILVIEDDKQMRLFLKSLLRQSQYDVMTAQNGQEGLAYYRRFPVDLVITDLFMPEKEGMETITELRQVNPRLKIIAISGGTPASPVDFLPMAKKLGAYRTLAKPFGRSEILEAVAEAFKPQKAASVPPQPEVVGRTAN